MRACAETVAGLGFTHVLAYDHVLGADPSVHAPWDRPYDVRTTFHEPMVLFGFLAAFTSLEGGARPAPRTCRSTRWGAGLGPVGGRLAALTQAAEALGLPA